LRAAAATNRRHPGEGVAPNHQSDCDFCSRLEILLTVRPRVSFLSSKGGSRTDAMIETVTAFFGFISASIFLAHAYEGYRSRPVLQKERFRKL
jgi:hypothetical protein